MYKSTYRSLCSDFEHVTCTELPIYNTWDKHDSYEMDDEEIQYSRRRQNHETEEDCCIIPSPPFELSCYNREEEGCGIIPSPPFELTNYNNTEEVDDEKLTTQYRDETEEESCIIPSPPPFVLEKVPYTAFKGVIRRRSSPTSSSSSSPFKQHGFSKREHKIPRWWVKPIVKKVIRTKKPIIIVKRHLNK